MIRVALDSDNLASLPAGIAPLLLSYSDLFPTLAALRDFEAARPGSEVVLIDRDLGDPTGLATIADVEPGALTPPDLPFWFDRKTGQGLAYLTVYSDRYNLPDCDNALKGTPYEEHWRWVATLDGTCFISGMDPFVRPAVVQVLNAESTGRDFDLSLVNEDGWHPVAS
jgi:hypothetical protein